MGEQLYVVVYKKRVITTTRTGRKVSSGCELSRALSKDDVSTLVAERPSEKLPEWVR
jgi:hypothetical protein